RLTPHRSTLFPYTTLFRSLDQVRRQLLSDGRVCVVTSAAHLANVARYLQKLLAEELEASFLLLPASITGVTRGGSNWRIMLGLRSEERRVGKSGDVGASRV